MVLQALGRASGMVFGGRSVLFFEHFPDMQASPEHVFVCILFFAAVFLP